MNGGNTIHHLKEYLCENWDNGKFKKCNEGATVLCLTTISGYQAGETILGDLKKRGWVVLRGINVNEEVNFRLRRLLTKGSGNPFPHRRTG